MRLPNLTPAGYRRITLAALYALVFIVITGGAVRLTGSGLGCPDWPTCDNQRLVPPWQYHAMVEFVNRTITGLVSVAVILAVLGSLARRPRRRDLVWLSLGLVVGVLGQIVLGGLTVLFDLKPGFVMAHFLLSMVLLANAVVLHERAGRPPGPRRPLGDGGLRFLGRLVVLQAVVVLFVGTVVTSSGPHGGDPAAERLPFVVADVARLHGIAVVLLVLLAVVTVALVARLGATGGEALRRGQVLLAVLVAQAAVGYLQYFTGVPPLLVGIHIAGAAAAWIAALRFQLALSAPGGRPQELDEARPVAGSPEPAAT